MGKVKEYVIRHETLSEEPAAGFDEDDIFEGDDSDNEIDLYAPVNYDDMAQVLQRIFAVVERYPTGDESAWYYYLNDWDRRFVLNIYDMFITTGKAPLSPKQISKATVILRKMMTPSMSNGREF